MKLVSRRPRKTGAELVKTLCAERDALLDTNKNLRTKLSLYELENAHLSEELAAVKGEEPCARAPADLRRENLRLRCRNAWLEAELEKLNKAHEWLLEAHLRTVNTYLDLEKELPPNG